MRESESLQDANPAETIRAVSIPTSPDPPRGVALFDLDGTLLAWDCQLLFCHRVLRREGWRRLFLLVFLPFTPFARLLGTAIMKRIFLCYLWRMSREAIASHARAFAQELTFYQEILEALERHRRDGHLLILASASPEFYVTEIGKRLGFHHSLGTPVEIDGRSALFPDLENHKGEAKVDRLHGLLPREWFHHGKLPNSHGYTDSTADLPMLALCEHATLVNPGEHLTDIGGLRHWTVVRPERPWKSTFERAWRSLALLLGIGVDPGKAGER